jgi:ubiquitin-conjugating enzyme (huntingtin interacting protein 2)
MSAAKQKRLNKEIKDCAADSEMTGISATPVGDSLEHLKGTLKGPKDSPYENGVFTVDIHIPLEYPFKPPKMKFDTRVWHPNVSSQTGAICLDILGKEWSPALTIKTTLLSLQLLLDEPVPDDPQDATVAAMYKNDRNKYDETAREWSDKYAIAGAVSSPITVGNVEVSLADTRASGSATYNAGSASSASQSEGGACCIIL